MYAIIGNTFGGTQGQTFMLPNIQGQVLVSAGQMTDGQNYVWGKGGGAAAVAITGQQMNSHNHTFNAALQPIAAAVVCETNIPGPTTYLSNVVGKNGGNNVAGRAYADTNAINTILNTNSILPGGAGSGIAHDNMSPYVPINYCIALEGIYPVRD